MEVAVCDTDTVSMVGLSRLTSAVLYLVNLFNSVSITFSCWNMSSHKHTCTHAHTLSLTHTVTRREIQTLLSVERVEPQVTLTSEVFSFCYNTTKPTATTLEVLA